jgi:ATP-dependent DNA ligase
MRLSRRPEPFDSDDYIFELKIDGFRALAHIRQATVKLVFEKWEHLSRRRKPATWVHQVA